ncbi:MAG: anti-sigma factor [Gammaproteobacteria bacterium]|nr:anti-sigma factor [Gammaproteobacteria bacterium]MDH4254109.1 anti-sigma factor [Gammaproteobacteria bacterium]MDH5309057.1 anti-sigma factor [Gammaproteobacteria bacterium]
MDKLEHELKQDAARIRADVTPELRARIEASLRAARLDRRESRDVRPGSYFWWFSGLTGVAATLLVVALLNRAGDPDTVAPDAPPANVVVVRGDTVDVRLVPLDVRNADFTEPLEDELEKLKSDLEKARDEVERDIRFSF